MPVRARHRFSAAILPFAAAAAGTASAQEAHDADALAKQLSNPVASLISVPFQSNVDFGFGDLEGIKYTLNVQPVIPFSLTENWNLIVRVIAPIIVQNDVFGASGTQSGLSDLTPTFFLSPHAPTSRGLIWGVGPAFLVPTTSDALLGADQWAAGPSIVGLKQTTSGWTYGMLANHLWGVESHPNGSEVNNTFMQPFLTKGLGQGRTLGLNLEASYNWTNNDATVPMNLFYTNISKIGSQLVSWGPGVRAFLERPAGGPEWGARFLVTLLFPK